MRSGRGTAFHIEVLKILGDKTIVDQDRVVRAPDAKMLAVGDPAVNLNVATGFFVTVEI